MDWLLLHPLWAIGLPIAASLPLGWLMWKVLDPPADRVGRGLDAVPVALLRLFGHREPIEMGWKRYAMALAGLQRRAVRPVVRRALGTGVAAAQSRRQGAAHRARLQGRRRHRAPRRRYGGDLQHGLLVRDQHQPPALLGRAASVVLQPARRDRLAPVRHPGVRAGRDAGRDPRPARRQASGRLLPRHGARRRPRADPAVARGRRPAGLDGRADDLPWRGEGGDPRGRHPDDRDGARRRRGRHQAARHQRRRVLRAQLGPPLREPDPVEQPPRGRLASS